MGEEVKTHPVQTVGHYHGKKQAKAPQVVTLKAYEVYCHLYGEQKALIEGWCRGGFGAGELITYLYASSFPKSEWRQRVDEAMNGMEGL